VSLIKPILLAEDLEDDAIATQRILKKAGVMNPIVVVPDGEEAILYLDGVGMYGDREKYPIPVVLLLDLKMPKRGGLDVLGWCRAQKRMESLLIVILTGHQDVSMMHNAYAMGAHSFLMKPCNETDIVNLTQTFAGYWHHAPPQL